MLRVSTKMYCTINEKEGKLLKKMNIQMVKDRSTLLKKVQSLYKEVEQKIAKAENLAGMCKACGKCCDFESFGHKLYVSSPELIYFADKLRARGIKLKTMKTGICPYNVKGKCTAHEERFLGCRIFCCDGDEDFQSDLTEYSLKIIKSICEEEEIPYQYMNLSQALVPLAENGRTRGFTTKDTKSTKHGF